MLACVSFSTSGTNTIVRFFTADVEYQKTISGTFAANSGTLRIGVEAGATQNYIGFIHKLRVYKAFMRSDLTDIVNFTSCPGCSSCPYYHLCLCPAAYPTTKRDCSTCSGSACPSCTAPCMRTSGTTISPQAYDCSGGCDICMTSSTSGCGTCFQGTKPDTSQSPPLICVCLSGTYNIGTSDNPEYYHPD